MRSFPPKAVLPSAEGGIGMTFRRGDRYASLEILNQGRCVLLMAKDDEAAEAVEAGVDAWEILGFIKQTRAFLEQHTGEVENQWASD